MVGRAPIGNRPKGGGPDDSERGRFHEKLLQVANRTRIPVRVGGTCAVNIYLRMSRETKDLDLFCKPSEYPRLLAAFADAGFKTEVEDERWVAKVICDQEFCDIIFGSANMIAPITDEWMHERFPATIQGVRVKLLPPTELIWSKSFIMDRNRFDGGDVAHLILKLHQHIDWKRLLTHMDQHWEVLLIHLISFRYIYPSERDIIPRWLIDELLSRLGTQMRLPCSNKRVCRGRIFSRDDYQIDIDEWGFADLVGDDWTP